MLIPDLAMQGVPTAPVSASVRPASAPRWGGLAVALLVLLAAVPAAAQGTIAGTITDPASGFTVINASVFVLGNSLRLRGFAPHPETAKKITASSETKGALA